MRIIKLLLALTVFTVQTSGLHVHSHKSTNAAHPPAATLVHLALVTDHTSDQNKHHDQDTELSVPENGLLKKTGGDKDLVALPTLRHASPAPLHLGNNLIAAACLFPELLTPAFTRPPLRAPPAFHLV